jgi:hypothetical protein
MSRPKNRLNKFALLMSPGRSHNFRGNAHLVRRFSNDSLGLAYRTGKAARRQTKAAAV